MTAKIWAAERLLVMVLTFAATVGSRGVLAQCRFRDASARDAVTYRISAEETTAGMQLNIRMTFYVEAGVAVEINVPSNRITDLHLEGSRAVMKDSASGGKTVTSPTSGRVSLDYTVHNGWDGPLVHPHEFQPVVRPQYTEITGDKALVWLSSYRNAPLTANFDWQHMPPSWTLATSFGVAESVSTYGPGREEAIYQQRCQSYTGPWIKVNQALFAAGDFRLHPFRIGLRTGVLAIRGTWTFSDDEAANRIGRTIRVIRDFWHDDAFPYFMVTLQPFDQDHGSSDGTAFTDAFWMYVSRKDEMNGLLSQLAHEAFHAWDPLKMGDLSSTEYEKTKWFKEGFTEYYAQKLTYADGDITADQLLTSINKDLLAFPSSTNEYVRGRIIALWLDAAIRNESHGKYSLDSVMFRMVQDRKHPLTEQRIFATVAHYASARTVSLLAQAADHQGNIPAPKNIPGIGDCYQVRHGEFPMFDLGFDYKTSRTTKVLAGVAPGGPAFQAGLRDGQRFVSANFNRDDPGELAIITVRIDGKDKQISFKPVGPSVTAWQYASDAGQRCAESKYDARSKTVSPHRGGHSSEGAARIPIRSHSKKCHPERRRSRSRRICGCLSPSLRSS